MNHVVKEWELFPVLSLGIDIPMFKVIKLDPFDLDTWIPQYELIVSKSIAEVFSQQLALSLYLLA